MAVMAARSSRFMKGQSMSPMPRWLLLTILGGVACAVLLVGFGLVIIGVSITAS